MRETQSQSILVTTEAVAVHFGVSIGTVNVWVRKGRIPCVRASRRIIRFRLADVEEALTRPAVEAPRG